MQASPTKYKKQKRKSNHRRYHRRYGHISQRKYKVLKAPNTEHPENSGHIGKITPKHNRNKRG